jgi:nitrate reductase beta subunit
MNKFLVLFVACAAALPSQQMEKRQQDTIVLFELGGVPGNECLTFRNNGMSVRI